MRSHRQTEMNAFSTENALILNVMFVLRPLSLKVLFFFFLYIVDVIAKDIIVHWRSYCC